MEWLTLIGLFALAAIAYAAGHAHGRLDERHRARGDTRPYLEFKPNDGFVFPNGGMIRAKNDGTLSVQGDVKMMTVTGKRDDA